VAAVREHNDGDVMHDALQGRQRLLERVLVIAGTVELVHDFLEVPSSSSSASKLK